MNLETFKELLLKQQSSGLTVKAFCEDQESIPASSNGGLKMPYMKKASQEELLQLLPHHWKHQHPETLPPTKEN